MSGAPNQQDTIDGSRYGVRVAHALRALEAIQCTGCAQAVRDELDRLASAVDREQRRADSEALRALKADARADEAISEADRLREALEIAEDKRERQTDISDSWRGVYYSAAERADAEARRAERFAAFADQQKQRAERAEALAESRKGFGEAVSEAASVSRPMSEGGQRFAVVFRSIDGFTEHRRREIVHAVDYPDAQGLAGEMRRPCERVHSVEAIK